VGGVSLVRTNVLYSDEFDKRLASLSMGASDGSRLPSPECCAAFNHQVDNTRSVSGFRREWLTAV